MHAWDLARATGADEQLGADLVEQALVPYTAWVATLDIDGLFDRPNEPVDGPAQDRLLGELGRRP